MGIEILVGALPILANTATESKSFLEPTLLGIAVVVASVGLFIGSTFLLLATNLGARLAFLVTTSALAGFMTLLSFLWMINTSPLTSLHGPSPGWKVKEQVASLGDSKFAPVRSIATESQKIDAAGASSLRAALDSTLAHEGGEYFFSTDTTAYTVVDTYKVGGERTGFMGWWHVPLYGAVTYCPVLEVEEDVNAAPPVPKCDPAQDEATVVFLRDLGALRQPPVMVFFASGLLFALSLLILHWRERDQMAADEAADVADGKVAGDGPSNSGEPVTTGAEPDLVDA